MLIKYHDLETYYLHRRLDLLSRLNEYAEQSLHDQDFDDDSLHPAIEILKKQYSDVIDPENLNRTLKRIYPKHLYGIESNKK